MGWYDDVATHAVRREIQIHFGLERACKVAFDHHAAETALAARLYFRTEVLMPIERHDIAVAAPTDRDLAIRYRERAELCRVDRQLM